MIREIYSAQGDRGGDYDSAEGKEEAFEQRERRVAVWELLL